MGGVVSGITSIITGGGNAGTARTAAGAMEQTAGNVYNKTLDANAPYVAGGQGAENTLQYLLGTGNADGSATGTNTSAGGANGGYGSLLQPFTTQQLYSDPSYNFRLQQGELALQRSGAAAGTITSGAGQEAINAYGQNQAATQYQQAFQNYQQNQNNIYGRLSGQVNTGQTANEANQAAGQNYAQMYNNALAYGANGAISGANTVASGLGSLGGSLFASGLGGTGSGATTSNFYTGGFASGLAGVNPADISWNTPSASLAAPGAAFSTGLTSSGGAANAGDLPSAPSVA